MRAHDFNVWNYCTLCFVQRGFHNGGDFLTIWSPDKTLLNVNLRPVWEEEPPCDRSVQKAMWEENIRKGDVRWI